VSVSSRRSFPTPRVLFRSLTLSQTHNRSHPRRFPAHQWAPSSFSSLLDRPFPISSFCSVVLFAPPPSRADTLRLANLHRVNPPTHSLARSRSSPSGARPGDFAPFELLRAIIIIPIGRPASDTGAARAQPKAGNEHSSLPRPSSLDAGLVRLIALSADIHLSFSHPQQTWLPPSAPPPSLATTTSQACRAPAKPENQGRPHLPTSG
jgi:hypothetical protein